MILTTWQNGKLGFYLALTGPGQDAGYATAPGVGETHAAIGLALKVLKRFRGS